MMDPYKERRLALLRSLYERGDGVLEWAAEAIGRETGGPIFEAVVVGKDSFALLRRLDQPSLDKGRSHAMVVPLQMPTRPRVDQVLEQRYLFVLGNLALFVSDELVHQLHETHLRDWGTTTNVHHSALVNQCPAIVRFPRVVIPHPEVDGIEAACP